MKTAKSIYHRHRFPKEIIRHAVWLYYRFCLSYRDVEDLLAERGFNVSYETIRRWCIRFVDEVFVRIAGQQRYLVRAELSHESTRQRERRMRRFKSVRHAQLFLSVHGTIQNLFAIPRHLLRAKHYRTFRSGAFDIYEQVTCA
jgi:transposase-like protein